jgi:hypothetical protein
MSSPAPECTHSKSRVYFDEGNIVLLSQDGVAFRVYKDVLAFHSPVFKDMFAFGSDASQAQHLDTSEMHDGCPLIKLQDSSDALEHLLKLLFGIDAP